MRKYENLWNIIRDNKVASIVAPVESHTKIVVAVRKEKLKDISFAYMNAETGVNYRLTNTSKGEVVTFTLELWNVKLDKGVNITPDLL